jgi:hypothetical protein
MAANQTVAIKTLAKFGDGPNRPEVPLKIPSGK